MDSFAQLVYGWMDGFLCLNDDVLRVALIAAMHSLVCSVRATQKRE